MNYYEHHIGDYAAATAHLSLIEDALFSRMLRRYYLQEQPLPGDVAQVARLCGARSADEVEAVGVVLSEFFHLEADGWHNKRADEEIERYRNKIDAARENGRKGGRPPNKPKETQPFQSGSENKTQPKAHQTPDTSNTQPNGCGADAPADAPADPIWGTGLAFLIRKGVPMKSARGLLGKVKQACGDIEAGALLAQAEADDITDPAPWLMAAASSRRSRAGPQKDQQPMGKTAQALMALEEFGNGGLDQARDFGGSEAADVFGPGADAGSRGYPADRRRLAGSGH